LASVFGSLAFDCGSLASVCGDMASVCEVMASVRGSFVYFHLCYL
jgi:hypothetical protein